MKSRIAECGLRIYWAIGRLVKSAIRNPQSAMSAESLINLRPVDHVPPGVDVVRPAILVLQVVRVLPDVDAEDRVLAVHQRTVLVRGALDGQLVAAADHPRPA